MGVFESPLVLPKNFGSNFILLLVIQLFLPEYFPRNGRFSSSFSKYFYA